MPEQLDFRGEAHVDTVKIGKRAGPWYGLTAPECPPCADWLFLYR